MTHKPRLLGCKALQPKQHSRATGHFIQPHPMIQCVSQWRACIWHWIETSQIREAKGRGLTVSVLYYTYTGKQSIQLQECCSHFEVAIHGLTALAIVALFAASIRCVILAIFTVNNFSHPPNTTRSSSQNHVFDLIHSFFQNISLCSME